ncbi:hypothetical protein BDB00DRAFT_862470 [Zychaea mexicana]|uniref:uncharacterized protein n=1 Tax=Zychaea mexicana TaxID=64656 RepID=UPI0022FEA56B|nr:uncharacterized protein BDB00DRAFT_862470 [Zychaea mexicana]KAI9471374.1 hypothetical protein BDB00DRAFT_862470 [Zychaea mexicana]
MGLDMKKYRSWATTTARMSTTTYKFYHRRPQHQQSNALPPPIYRLSDDVLLYLLLCPELDFKSLYAIAQASNRFRGLVCQLLRLYLLPDIQLTTMIDQEGRGRWTCRYSFDSLDETTLSATFIPTSTSSDSSGNDHHPRREYCFKRYRCDGSSDTPTLRKIEVLHGDDLKSSSLFIKDTRRYREKKKKSIENREHPLERTSITRQTRRIGIQRCGIRSIRAKHHLVQERLAAKIYHNSNNNASHAFTNASSLPPSWRLMYSVSIQQPVTSSPAFDCASTSSSSNSSSASLPQQHDQYNNKQYARSPCSNAVAAVDRNQGTARYITPLCLAVDVSMLGQRSSNNNSGYKRLINHLPPLCWIRRKWWVSRQTTAIAT